MDLMKDIVSAGTSQLHIVKNCLTDLLLTLYPSYEAMKLCINVVDLTPKPITKPWNNSSLAMAQAPWIVTMWYGFPLVD